MLGVVQALMPLMDGLFINNISGTLVASAVTFSEPVINMMTALSQGLSVAAMAIIGQLNGRGNFAESKRTSTQIVVAGSILGCLSAPLLVGAGALITESVNVQISRNVFLYLSLYSFVLLFAFMEDIYNGIKNANSQPEALFARMVIMLILKIAFNVLFIYILRLGIVGCALSSLLANIIVTVWMYHELFVKKGPDRLELKGFRFETTILKRLARIGTPARLSCIVGYAKSAATTVVVIAIIVPLSSRLTILFTRQADVLEIANRTLNIYTYSVVGFGICMTIQGAFIWLGRTKVSLVLGFLRIWLLRYVFIFLTEGSLGYYSVFWGNLFSNYEAAILAIILIARVKWKSSIEVPGGEAVLA